MNIGIGHGYYAIKTRHFSFPAGIAVYSHKPYTLQNTMEFDGNAVTKAPVTLTSQLSGFGEDKMEAEADKGGGKFFVCGTGRQPILRNKMENDNDYLLTLAAIAKEIKQRGHKTECSVNWPGRAAAWMRTPGKSSRSGPPLHRMPSLSSHGIGV